MGDIASRFHWKSDIQPVCIDVAARQTHGNILQHESWLQLIRARGFVGGHAGPSCEA